MNRGELIVVFCVLGALVAVGAFLVGLVFHRCRSLRNEIG